MKFAFRVAALLIIATTVHISPASACGGLFCQNIPVNQAGEQILFHQEDDYTTAMVRILYQGEAQDFSWVVPVPDTPELSTGSDSFFDELDNSTRPRFVLDRSGNGACFINGFDGTVQASLPDAAGESAGDSVTIEQELSVGPFDIQIVSSTNPDEMATWLEDNNYDLSDRGRELIAPYVADGMKFVAVKLRSGQSSGAIQPLIMKYKSTKPMVPIKLTAVAALEDMGVLVWLVSDARAVPDNYLHVVPNYTRLNWYTGPNNAYGSYQSLITAAMNEAGGQGFATDFAGTIDDATTQFLTTAEDLQQELDNLDQRGNDNEFLASLYRGPRTDALRALYQQYLPLPQGQDEGVYFESFALESNYTADELAQARVNIRQAFIDVEIDPLRNSIDLIPTGRYLTRLYTTLSADEMTLDPSFEFNPAMEPQSRTRRATLVENCENNETVWSLILGEGTGRDGETVMNGTSQSPISVPAPAVQQDAVFSTAKTSGDAMPELLRVNSFDRISLSDAKSSNSFLGGVSPWWLLLSLVMLRRQQR